MGRYEWSHLNGQQAGKYAEYFVKMEFTMFGWQVYTTEVDNRGIDFVARDDKGDFFEVQVKSVRGWNYIFLANGKFELKANLIAAVVILNDGLPPALYLIPSLEWQNCSPGGLLCSHDYEGKKTKPEWGINFSKNGQSLLKQYEFDRIIGSLSQATQEPRSP